MAGKSKLHLVDGEYVTVQEVADRLGVTRQQIYSQIHNNHVSLQVASNMIRDNMVLGGNGGRASRYMVDGRWLTIKDAAGQLNVKPCALRSYMYKHRLSLGEAMQAYRQGCVKWGGKRYQEHRVGRRIMTTQDVAVRFGISLNSIRGHMHRHKASLAQTIKYYERKQERQAEREILAILRGK